MLLFVGFFLLVWNYKVNLKHILCEYKSNCFYVTNTSMLCFNLNRATSRGKLNETSTADDTVQSSMLQSPKSKSRITRPSTPNVLKYVCLSRSALCCMFINCVKASHHFCRCWGPTHLELQGIDFQRICRIAR